MTKGAFRKGIVICPFMFIAWGVSWGLCAQGESRSFPKAVNVLTVLKIMVVAILGPEVCVDRLKYLSHDWMDRPALPIMPL